MKKLPPSKQQAFQSSPFKNSNNHQKSNSTNASKDLDIYLRQSSDQISYNFKEVDQFEDKSTLSKRQPRSKKQEIKQQQERSTSSGARLHDLCPEDKAKIGELVKKLALEAKQKQESSQKYEKEKEQMLQRMKELEKQTQNYEQEREKMTNKFTESLHMLKTMKEEHFKLEELKCKQDDELNQVKQELSRREQDLELQKQEQIKHLLDQQPVRDKDESKIIQMANNLSQNTNNNDQTINTLKEIADLKHEIIKLTTSLRSLKNSPEQSFKQKSRTSKGSRSKSKEYISSEENEEEWWETHSRGTKKQLKKDNSTLLLSRIEDLKTMKVEDLHNLQEELTKKLEITNSLLFTKQPESNHKKDSKLLSARRSSSKLKNLDESKMAKLMEQAATEYDDYFSSSPTPRPSRGAPEPASLNKKDEILAKKMQMFKEIQQRFQPNNESTKSSPNKYDVDEKPERDTNTKYIGSSYYKNLIQQQTQILQNQKSGKPPQPTQKPFNFENIKEDLYIHTTSENPYVNTTSEQQMDDSDDDLIYSLNQKSRGVDDQLKRSQHQQQEDPLKPHYDDSLLTIIDEIEQDQLHTESLMITQSQQQESARYQMSSSKQPNSYFQQQLQQPHYYQPDYRQKAPEPQLQQSYLRTPLPQQLPYQSLRQSNDFNPVNQSTSSYQNNNSTYKNNPYYLKAKQEVDQLYQGGDTKLSRMMQGIRDTEQCIPPQQQQQSLISELQKLNFNYDDKENLRNRQYENQHMMSLNGRKQVQFNM